MMSLAITLKCGVAENDLGYNKIMTELERLHRKLDRVYNSKKGGIILISDTSKKNISFMCSGLCIHDIECLADYMIETITTDDLKIENLTLEIADLPEKKERSIN